MSNGDCSLHTRLVYQDFTVQFQFASVSYIDFSDITSARGVDVIVGSFPVNETGLHLDASIIDALVSSGGNRAFKFIGHFASW